MNNNPWNDDFVQPSRASWWSSKVTLIVILALAVFVGLIVFWNLIVSHTDDMDDSNIPIVAAETLTLKEHPQKMTIEEGDSVYSLISQEKSKSSSLKTDAEDPVYETSFQREGDSRSQGDREEKTEIINIKTTSPSHTDHNQKKLSKENIFFLQIGSLPSQEGAQAESHRLQKKYKPLQSIEIKIVSKELPGKGTYHRLHAGPFENKEEAQKVCQHLVEMGAHCLVVQ